MDIIQTWLSVIKDMVTIFAAGVAGYVGLAGLDAWKKQLTANAEYTLAKRVLAAVYRVRDAIVLYRLPRMYIGSPLKPLHEESLAKLADAGAALEVDLLEAEAVWGSEEDYDSVFEVLTLAETVKSAHSTYYSDYVVSDAVNPNAKEEAESTIFTKGPYPKDEFSVTLDKAVSQVEDFLRPKLTLKHARRKKRHWWDKFKKQKKQSL